MRDMKKTEKWGLVLVAALALTAGIVNEDMTYNGKVVFDAGARVHLNGPWSIDGTEVTATAANLNAGLASSTANLVSNATLKVYGSNAVVVAGGTVTLGQGVAVTGAGATLTISNVTQTAASLFTGLRVAGGTLTGTITNDGATIGATASSGTVNFSNATQTAGGTLTGLSVAGGTVAGTVTNGGTISGGTVSAITLGAANSGLTVSNITQTASGVWNDQIRFAATTATSSPTLGAASNLNWELPAGITSTTTPFWGRATINAKQRKISFLPT